MDDFFDFRELRVRQPGKILPGKASYEIFDDKKHLIAAALETDEVETRGGSVVDKITKALPESRVFAVTSPAGEYLYTLAFDDTWLAELTDADGTRLGSIRVDGNRRQYYLLDAEGTEIGLANGDLSVTRFALTGAGVPPFGEIRKTFAGPLKEAFTSADHYTIKFTGTRIPVLLRTLAVMVPIALDLAKYGPA